MSTYRSCGVGGIVGFPNSLTLILRVLIAAVCAYLLAIRFRRDDDDEVSRLVDCSALILIATFSSAFRSAGGCTALFLLQRSWVSLCRCSRAATDVMVAAVPHGESRRFSLAARRVVVVAHSPYG